jgi:hypothetical protein
MLEWFDTMQSATSAHGSQKVRKARSIALTCDNGSIALESALSKTVGEEVEFLPARPELEPYTGPGRTGFFASCRFPLEPEATSEAAEPMQRKKSKQALANSSSLRKITGRSGGIGTRESVKGRTSQRRSLVTSTYQLGTTERIGTIQTAPG